MIYCCHSAATAAEALDWSAQASAKYNSRNIYLRQYCVGVCRITGMYYVLNENVDKISGWMELQNKIFQVFTYPLRMKVTKKSV